MECIKKCDGRKHALEIKAGEGSKLCHLDWWNNPYNVLGVVNSFVPMVIFSEIYT